MAKFFLKYNPYKVESIMQLNGQDISEDSKLFAFRNERLQVWLDRLFPILIEECNDDKLDVTFYGTALDYEDVKEYIRCNSESGLAISVEHIPVEDSGGKLQALLKLFEDMQDGPFEDLKDSQIRENFEKVIGSEFEVSVIATMSSGKSTLINSLLGQELMPAKNEACTATIARIKDIDGKPNFSAICKGQDGKVLSQHADANLQIIRNANEDDAVSYIDLEGDIPFINSSKTQLVLIDTPGPNNSRNQDHRDHTYRFIKHSAKPMVLYVLNATQLATDDDSVLLGSVAEAMKVGGKQSKDRFLFAVNKIDEYDTEREDSIEDALHNIRAYLERHGIVNPNIFPTSAEMAKVIRMYQNGIQLSRKQEKTLEQYDLFNDVPQMHLTKYTPLSEAAKRKLKQRIQEARDHQQPYEEALVHTGIPAIEEAINEYLDKYAITAKIKNAVDTFRKKVEEKQMLDQLLHEIEHNVEERERIGSQLKKIRKQLDEGKATEKFKEKIKALQVSQDNIKRVHEIRAKIDSILQGYATTKMTRLEMEQQMTKFVRKVQNLQSDVVTELEKLVNEGLKQEAEKLVTEYAGYIQSMMQDNVFTIGKVDLTSEKFILADLPDASGLIEKHKKNEREKVGEKWVENTNKKWWKFWTWFDEDGHYKDVYETREYVDAKQVFDEFTKIIRGDFFENIRRAEVHLKEETENLKNYFMQELVKLDAVVKKKIHQLEDLTGDSRKLEELIQADREKMEWLKQFLTKLDTILEI